MPSSTETSQPRRLKYSETSMWEIHISHVQECSMPTIENMLTCDPLILPAYTDPENDQS